MARLYVIKDVVADVVQSGPFPSVNDGVIIRQFMDMLNSNNQMGQMYRSNPADFELWFIGEMDDKTGFITPAETPLMDASFICVVFA